MGAKSFMDLTVWQKAYARSMQIDTLTKAFPAKERYRLADQMRSAASSIPMNIAEGFGRWSSGNELKVQLMRTVDLGYSDDVFELASLLDEVCAMLYVLRKRVLSRGAGG